MAMAEVLVVAMVIAMKTNTKEKRKRKGRRVPQSRKVRTGRHLHGGAPVQLLVVGLDISLLLSPTHTLNQHITR
jgi:hypothetical protein